MTQPTCETLRVRTLTPLTDSPNEEQSLFYELLLEPPAWEGWQAGQFVMLRPENWDAELTWARPFSICSVSDEGLTIFFQVLGRGTSRMAKLQPGDALSVWGPLGEGFAQEPNTPTLLLAGGVGIAPFIGYAQSHAQPENLSLLFGHRPALNCYPYDALSRLITAEHFQEHGTEDIQRFVTLLGERVRANKESLTLACGPLPFLRTVQKLALENKARVQLSLENRMACGVGACLGCVCKDKEGWPIQVCTKGPVFWADAISLDEGV